MDADQARDSYQDSKNNLHVAIRWIPREQAPEQKPESGQLKPPTEFLMDNLGVLKEICRKYSTHAERMASNLSAITYNRKGNVFKHVQTASTHYFGCYSKNG